MYRVCIFTHAVPQVTIIKVTVGIIDLYSKKFSGFSNSKQWVISKSFHLRNNKSEVPAAMDMHQSLKYLSHHYWNRSLLWRFLYSSACSLAMQYFDMFFTPVPINSSPLPGTHSTLSDYFLTIEVPITITEITVLSQSIFSFPQDRASCSLSITSVQHKPRWHPKTFRKNLTTIIFS